MWIGFWTERSGPGFDGEKVSGWNSNVAVFEKVCRSKDWDGVHEETLVELITGRLTGKAKKVWEEWVQEESEMLSDYLKLKTFFTTRFDEEINPWRKLVDFHNLKMGKESMDEYGKKYLEATLTVDSEGCVMAKFYFSLTIRIIRELINRSTGEWPKTLNKMIDRSC